MPDGAAALRIRNYLACACGIGLLALAPGLASAAATGVSPYLPLDMSPDIARRIERVLILADKPVMRRPIAAATVLYALPKACAIDRELCREVTTYLSRYMADSSVTDLRVEAALSSGDGRKVVPNAYGLTTGDHWQIMGNAFYQPWAYALVNVGAIAQQGRTKPTGSYLSLGVDFAQLDIGYRGHWLSPLSDGSVLVSNEAPTMPSITLSNYVPISRLGLNYEIFAAQMSRQDGIVYFDSRTSGNPRLAGLQLGLEPVSGYALTVNRIMQYGGGARTAGPRQFIDALYRNANDPDVAGRSQEFGNQAASITSSILFPGKTPFAVHLEYAGEDNAYDVSYRLGSTYLAVGLDVPKIGSRYDLGFEIAEWQQPWYVHHLYPQGLTNYGRVIGHWFGDNRQAGDAYYGNSQSLALGVQFSANRYLRVRYRTLANTPHAEFSYQRLHELELSYSTAWRGRKLDAGLYAGKDVFGASFARVSGTLDFTPMSGRRPVDADSSPGSDAKTALFVDVGANYSHVYNRVAFAIPNFWSDFATGYHYGIGARRQVSKRNDLGVRAEFDRIGGRSLVSLRALDYRFRWNNKLAINGFVGASRYDVASLAADGYYWGAGLQWMNLLPGWDLGLDIRHNEKLTRSKLLPTDILRNDNHGLYFDTNGGTLYLSRRF
jgi:hypothetical protein